MDGTTWKLKFPRSKGSAQLHAMEKVFTNGTWDKQQLPRIYKESQRSNAKGKKTAIHKQANKLDKQF